jgi:proteasome lid subunit RPN8/RPN11
MILVRRQMRNRFGSFNVRNHRTSKTSQILAQHPELIMLGWIHTHPDYQAFLSSVDMHNQYLYQSLLPEALALVVSVRYFLNGFRY